MNPTPPDQPEDAALRELIVSTLWAKNYSELLPRDKHIVRRLVKELLSEQAKAVQAARIDELKMLMAKHSRTYKQTITDSNGDVYLEDSHAYISKYETQERIAELQAAQPPAADTTKQGEGE